MKRIASALWLGTAMLQASMSVAAATIYVDRHNPSCPGTGTAADPFCLIQDGIVAAVDGDVVLVAPGTYGEHIDFLGKAIAVLARDGAAVTIIDGLGAESVVRFVTAEGPDSRLEGFTVTNGKATRGGGILCVGSSPTIVENTISANLAQHPDFGSGYGGGIYCESGSPAIVGNTIQNNTANQNGLYLDATGGGICCVSSSPLITSNRIVGNSADGASIFKAGGNAMGGGIACIGGAPTILENVISGNFAVVNVGELCWARGGGIFCSHSTATIDRNTILENQATTIALSFNQGEGGGFCGDQGSAMLEDNVIARNSVASAVSIGGGIFCRDTLVTVSHATIAANSVQGTTHQGGGIMTTGSTVLANVILWANTTDQISASGDVTADYCDVQGGYPGTGNIDVDPVFDSDYRLASSSPCVDAGDPAEVSCSPELAGNPRRLDGHLSGVPRSDIGAFEWSNVLLAVSGTPVLGGTLTIDTSGTAGLDVILLVGTAAGEACLFPYGSLFFSVVDPWTLVPWGQIPSSVQVTIPSSLPVPLPIVLQELARNASSAGNTSNAVSLTIH